jgi:rod shape-determining protein MreC
MVAIPSRHRSLALLAVVVAAQVLLLAVQIRRERQGRLIRVWSVTLLAPIERAGVWTIDNIRGIWSHYAGLRDTSRENRELHEALNRLKLRNIVLESKAAESDRLAALLAFRQAHEDVPMIAARVIGAGADPSDKVIYLNRGEHHNLKRNMGVITPDGVVGKVIEVYPEAAQVLLITDKESGVGAMLADTRTQTPADGLGEAQLALKYVSNDEKVYVGERVVTSGQDRIFPKGWPVGAVISATPGNPFQMIRLGPAANLQHLEEVFVLPSQQDLEPKKDAPKAAEAPPKKNAPMAPAGSPQ